MKQMTTLAINWKFVSMPFVSHSEPVETWFTSKIVDGMLTKVYINKYFDECMASEYKVVCTRHWTFMDTFDSLTDAMFYAQHCLQGMPEGS